MQQQYDRTAEISPRSGGSKRVTPAIWSAVILAMIVVAIYFAMKA